MPRSSAITGTALRSAPEGTPSAPATSATVVMPGVGHLARLVELRRHLDGLGLGARHLDVRGVPGRQRDLVLARGTWRHVLVSARAAHHPDVRFHLVEVESAALHDPRVGASVPLVLLVEPRLVAVERVRVLHHELARAEHSGARARLVALLHLELVQEERQVAVGADVVRHVEGEPLLVRHREHVRRALAVVELHQLLDLVAPGRLPEPRGLKHRNQELLAADRVHLLADDPDHVLRSRGGRRAARSKARRRAGARGPRGPSACARSPRRPRGRRGASA